MCRNVFVSITSSDIALHPKVPSHLPGSVSTIRWAQRPRLGKQFGMNPQQWLPGSSSHRSSSSGSGTMRQSAMYPQEHAPSLRHDQTPAKDSADMVGTGCCVCVVFPQVNEPPQTHRLLFLRGKNGGFVPNCGFSHVSGCFWAFFKNKKRHSL